MEGKLAGVDGGKQYTYCKSCTYRCPGSFVHVHHVMLSASFGPLRQARQILRCAQDDMLDL